jgi:phosphoribosyl 1,2-cyclic phosphodiesterase
MNVRFQSLRSSSSGNCLMVWADHTTLLLDCGIRTQQECQHLLGRHAGKLDAVLVSHAHGDHISYSALRVLGELNVPIHCHGDIIQQIHNKHIGDWDSPPHLHAFPERCFQVGDFEIEAVELPHDPDFPTFGFVIRAGGIKIIAATDFHATDGLAGHLVDADFIFIEANHDPDLLKKFWNHASTFHLSNPKTAKLLCQARKSSRKAPQQVMLGHLSKQRNTDDLAMDAVRQQFREERVELDFRLGVAPRYAASKVIALMSAFQES